MEEQRARLILMEEQRARLKLPLQHFECLSLVPATVLQLGPLRIMLRSRVVSSRQQARAAPCPLQRIRFLEFHAVMSYLKSSRIFAACVRQITKSQQGLLPRTRKELERRR
jgi:hypothetical protein